MHAGHAGQTAASRHSCVAQDQKNVERPPAQRAGGRFFFARIIASHFKRCLKPPVSSVANPPADTRAGFEVHVILRFVLTFNIGLAIRTYLQLRVAMPPETVEEYARRSQFVA